MEGKEKQKGRSRNPGQSGARKSVGRFQERRPFNTSKRVGVKAISRARPTVAVPARGQRLARNLVKRAMLRSRRQAIFNRRQNTLGDVSNRGMLAMDRELVASNGRTQQLQREVQKLRGAVQALSGALNRQQIRRISAFPARRRGQSNIRSIRSRVGWNTARRNFNVSRNYNQRPVTMANLPLTNRGRPTRGRGQRTFTGTSAVFSSMQSDLVSREQARQKRIMADLIALAESRNLVNAATRSTQRRFRPTPFSSPNKPFRRGGNFRSFNFFSNNGSAGFSGRIVSTPRDHFQNRIFSNRPGTSNQFRRSGNFRSKQFFRSRFQRNRTF